MIKSGKYIYIIIYLQNLFGYYKFEFIFIFFCKQIVFSKIQNPFIHIYIFHVCVLLVLNDDYLTLLDSL